MTEGSRQTDSGKTGRDRRLAEALWANLKRRKAQQQRGRPPLPEPQEKRPAEDDC